MKPHELLAQLNVLHQLMQHLLESTPADEARHGLLEGEPPLAWLFGRAVYLETYWLREVVLGDEGMTARVRALFAHDAAPTAAQLAQLPPPDHLLNWALELQEENLTLLANPSHLPAHPLVQEGRLLPRVVQQQAALCERMLAQASERQLRHAHDYHASVPLEAAPPSAEHVDVQQGHYRIGAKDDPAALDNELPPQIVHLHGFRIDAHPVRNAAWLGFIEAGGYDDPEFWSEAGWRWRQRHAPHPHHWRRDAAGGWFGVGINGAFDLIGEDAVYGISAHEAAAYAQWVASLGERFTGAVVQHEYQWEVAARTQAIADYGRVWEWCANPFHTYTGYQRPADGEAASSGFEGEQSLRGACLHSQRIQRRHSYRHHADPAQRQLFCGTRLVFPPSKMPWHTHD